MKNVILLPTDKPSRLYTLNSSKKLYYTNNNLNQIKFTVNQNIYITSDEEIKEGDWVKLFVKHIDKEWIHKITKEDLLLYTDFNNEASKIILTTDGDLIKDGVQAIDDEFLEWFVKNTSCEEVKTYYIPNEFRYEIIIPKEEPKQITSLDGDGLGGIPKGILTMLIGEKEETLKEAAEKYVNINVAKNAAKLMYKEHFIAGAKWQQERMHSDEEVFNLLMEFSSRDRNSSSGTPHSIAKWFEQFKKK